MKISIIIPIYKCEKYIERCARSLMEQTMLDDIEFIFINDCTPDNSMKILYKIISEYPHRQTQIRILENKVNLGISQTRKIAVYEAKGEYIAWCDSDDWMEKDMIENMYNATNKGKIDIIICNYILHYKNYDKKVIMNKTSTPQECIYNLWKGYYLPGSLCQQLHKKELINKSIGNLINTNYGEDIYTIISMLYYAQNIAYIDEYYYHYDKMNELSLLHNTNYSYQSWLFQKENIDKISNLLYSNNGYKKYHVAVNALKHSTKNHFKSAFKNIHSFYHTYKECYKDFNIYSFTPKQQRLKSYLIHNIYFLYWLYYQKEWKQN